MCRHETKYNGLTICDKAIADYRQILECQLELVEQRRENKIGDTVIIVEHKSVVTLGARESKNKLLISREDMLQGGTDVVDVRRGGGVTAHNPGQLVFYPVFDLRERQLGINEYIRQLEAVGIELLVRLGVAGERKKGFPGLWVGEKKIASIGVRVSKFITYHGMAINICNDLGIFDSFVPCGLDGVEMTSVLKETGVEQSMAEVKKILTEVLVKYFSGKESSDNEPNT